MAEYPHALVKHRVLFDATQVTIRPIRCEDSSMEQEFVRHLSEDSRYFRFMGTLRELPAKKLEYFTQIAGPATAPPKSPAPASSR